MKLCDHEIVPFLLGEKTLVTHFCHIFDSGTKTEKQLKPDIKRRKLGGKLYIRRKLN